MIRSIESHAACLVGGLAIGVLIMWGAGQNKRLKTELKTAQVVQTKTVENAERSNALEQGLVHNASKTDAAVNVAKSSLRKTPWVMVEKCQPGYTIQPGFGPDDWYDAYRAGRDSVLYPDRIRSGAGLRATPSDGLLSPAAAP